MPILSRVLRIARVLLEKMLLHTQSIITGTTVPASVYEMLASVDSAHERAVLHSQPLQAAARLEWVGKERGIPTSEILREIRGERSVAGIIVDTRAGACYPAHAVAV